RVGVVEGEPERHHAHGLERPVAAVLMPQHGLAVMGPFRDVVGGEQRDVGSDERLGYVEQARVGDEPHPERVVLHQLVMELLRTNAGVALEQPVDVPASLFHEVLVEDAVRKHVALALVVVDHVVSSLLAHLRHDSLLPQLSGTRRISGSVNTSDSSRLRVENSLTTAPSSPAWNQWSVSG